MRKFKKCISIFGVIIIAFSTLIAGTFCWQSLNQQALNEVYSATLPEIPVELHKLEKLSDGTLTEKPLSGAEFYLYTKENQQIGMLFTTDKEGKIKVNLPKGDYYFEEITPPIGYTYDKENEKEKRIYPFTVSGKETNPYVLKVYNQKLEGNLSISKEVKNANDDPLTEEQKNRSFTFKVTFSDGKEYAYRIGEGEEKVLKSGETLQLKHGETANFTGIPFGINYKVEEQQEKDYTFVSDNHRGTITESPSQVRFTNIFYQGEEKDTSLKILKKIDGEYPEKDKYKEFEFTLMIKHKEGKIQEIPFKLMPGQERVFHLPKGSSYEIKEEDYFSEGYIQSVILNGSGMATGDQVICAEITNNYIGNPQTEIKGTKFWRFPNNEKVTLPEYITVHLKTEDKLVKTSKIYPDEDGKWYYQFTAPKYDKNGEEIVYTVEEEPIKDYKATYSPGVEGEINILNTYEAPPPIENIKIKGTKSWNHKGNPKEKQPESITVYLYGDGKLVREQKVDAETNWNYTFDVPKVTEDGKEIVYTIGEERVKDYQMEIDGYNLTNTYVPGGEVIPPPESGEVDPIFGGNSPQTGDKNRICSWVLLLSISILLLVRLYRKRRDR